MEIEISIGHREPQSIYTEFEHLAINNKGRLISLGNPFDIYEFEYQAK